MLEVWNFVGSGVSLNDDFSQQKNHPNLNWVDLSDIWHHFFCHKVSFWIRTIDRHKHLSSHSRTAITETHSRTAITSNYRELQKLQKFQPLGQYFKLAAALFHIHCINYNWNVPLNDREQFVGRVHGFVRKFEIQQTCIWLVIAACHSYTCTFTYTNRVPAPNNETNYIIKRWLNRMWAWWKCTHRIQQKWHKSMCVCVCVYECMRSKSMNKADTMSMHYYAACSSMEMLNYGDKVCVAPILYFIWVKRKYWRSERTMTSTGCVTQWRRNGEPHN